MRLAPQQPKKTGYICPVFCFVRSVPGYLQRYCGQNEVRPQAARCSPATCGAARFSKWDTLMLVTTLFKKTPHQ